MGARGNNSPPSARFLFVAGLLVSLVRGPAGRLQHADGAPIGGLVAVTVRTDAKNFPGRFSAHAREGHVPLTEYAQPRGKVYTVRRKDVWGRV